MIKNQTHLKKRYYRIFSAFIIFICSSTLPALVYITTAGSCCDLSAKLTAEFLTRQAASPYPTSVITSPLHSVPVIQERGKTFEVRLNVSSDASDWNAWISTSYHEVPLTVDSALYDVSTETWSLSVKISSAAETELYNLIVQAKVGGVIKNFTQPRAVKVISHFPTDFEFIVMNDVTGAASYPVALRILEKAIEEINLINPSFVLFTGDLVNTGGHETEYQMFYDCLQMFEVPTYVAPGNHELYEDEEGVNYRRYIGPPYYSFDFGTYHIVTIDSGFGEIDSTQLDWVREDLASHANSTQIFMQLHLPIFPASEDIMHVKEPAKSTLLELIDQYDVSMVFMGHIHHDQVTTYQGHKFVHTTAIGGIIGHEGYARSHWGYRLVRVDGNRIVSYNYAGTTDETQRNAISFNELHATYFPSNNGTSSYVTATIDYGLEENLLDVLIKFVVPKQYGTGRYEVKNGVAIQIVNGTDRSVYYVETNLTARKAQFVAISFHQTSETLSTALTILNPEATTLGNLTVMTAKLTDQKNEPIPDQNLSFYICKITSTQVGSFLLKKEEEWSKIGSATTNEEGVASITYTPNLSGEFKVVAAYDGNLLYAGCSSIIAPLTVNPIEPPYALYGAIVLMIIGSLVGIAYWFKRRKPKAQKPLRARD